MIRSGLCVDRVADWLSAFLESCLSPVAYHEVNGEGGVVDRSEEITERVQVFCMCHL